MAVKNLDDELSMKWSRQLEKILLRLLQQEPKDPLQEADWDEDCLRRLSDETVVPWAEDPYVFQSKAKIREHTFQFCNVVENLSRLTRQS